MAIRRPPTTFSDSITGADLASDIAISTTGNIATTGSGTLTSAGAFTASGGIANAGTISAGTIGTSVTGFGLIRNAQQFRLVGDVDGSGGAGDAGAVIGKDSSGNNVLEEVDTDYQRHGTSIWSNTNGVFSCSVTGIFLCHWCVSYSDATGGDMADPNVQISTNSGGAFNARSVAWIHLSASEPTAMPVTNSFMFDVSNSSTFRLRFMQSLTNNVATTTHLKGSTSATYTNILFIRLGDT